MSTSVTNRAPFIEYLRDRVVDFENRYSLNTGKAFMTWYAMEALGLSEEDAVAAVAYDGANDKGIDLFHVDDENESIVVAQGRYRSNANYSPKPGELLVLTYSAKWLSDPETLRREGRPDLADAAEDYSAALAKGYTIDFHFVYTGPPKKEVTDVANHFNADLEGSPNQFARVVHLDLLQRIHDEFIDAATRIREATLSLDSGRAFSQQGDYGKALVTTVPAAELRRLYSDYGDALFDRNVRLYLGHRKGSVNAGIRETLESACKRKHFWAYNNGITIICDQFKFDPATGELVLHNFSIVNGCQTTVSIGLAPAVALPGVDIPVRFIEAQDREIVDSIIKYNNSQTNIREWDLASQDRVQKGLKNRLAEQPHPFFYELRRGEVSHISSEDRKRFTRDNKLQVIRPELLAQRLAAFKGQPVGAYKDKSSLLTTHRKTIFPNDVRVEDALLAWQCGEAAEELVRRELEVAQKQKDEQRARILRRGAKIFTIAVMGILLEERNGSMYLSRLKREVAGSKNTRKDLDVYATLGLSYYIDAVEDLLDMKNDLSVIVRSEPSYARIASKVRSKWKRDSISRPWLDAIPKMV